MADIQIRQLKVKDRITLSEMLKKLSGKLGDASILNCIIPLDGATKSEVKGKALFTSTGIKVIRLMFDTIEKDIMSWFASLINKTDNEYLEMSIDTEARIIDQLSNAKEVNDFFIHASHLYKRIRGSENQSVTGKTV